MNTPAFPQSDPIANEFHKKFGTDRGMTLRDYFAAKVMQGMMANGQVLKLVSDETLASAAYEMADAMLKAREV